MPETLNIADLDEQAPPISKPSDLGQFARATAQKYNIDPDLFSRMISAESAGNPNAVSTKGAMGMAQLMPGTAQDLNVDPKDPYQNIEGGARYLKQQLDRFGDPKKALAAYNWGPENVAQGKPWPKETTDYVGRIMGQGGGPTTLNIADLVNPESVPVDSNVQMSSLQNRLTEAGNYFRQMGKALRPYVPDIMGMIAGAATSELGPAAIPIGATVAALARGAEQAGLVQSGQTDPLTAATNVRNTAISNLVGGAVGKGIEELAPAAARWTYAKLAGVAPNDVKGMIAVNDMIDRNIPAGVGFFRKIGKLKDAENEGLNAIYDKYQMGPSTQALIKKGATLPATTNAVNKTDLFGDIANYYIHNTNAPRTEIEAAIGKDGYNLIEKVRAGQPITKSELDAVVSAADKNSAWGNFLGRKENEFSFQDAREIKQKLQGKIDIASKLEGMEAGRAVVAHHLVENIAKNIPDAADRAAFLRHNTELSKLINIEELPGMSKMNKRIIGGQIAMPVAGAIGGATTGYYSHQDPWAAALRGGIATGMMGATLPSLSARLLKSPAFQSLATLPTRVMTPPQRAATGPSLSNTDRERILKFLAQDNLSDIQ